MRWKTVRSRRPYYSSIIIHSSLPWMNFENRERIVLTIYSQPIYRHCSREKKWDSRTISSCFFTFRFFFQQQNQFRFSISNRVRWVVGILTWRNIFFFLDYVTKMNIMRVTFCIFREISKIWFCKVNFQR